MRTPTAVRPPTPGGVTGTLHWAIAGENGTPVSDSGPIEATPANPVQSQRVRMKLPWMDPHLPELLTLTVLAAFGCGLALAEGHFLFVGIFAAASAVMIIEAIRRSR